MKKETDKKKKETKRKQNGKRVNFKYTFRTTNHRYSLF